MAINTLSEANVRVNLNWSATKNRTGNGNDLSGWTDRQTIVRAISWSLGSGAGAIDFIHSQLYSITASGTTTIDLSSIVNVVQDTVTTVARIKGLYFNLVSATQDTTYGTACSQVTIGAAGANPHTMFLGGTTPTIVLKAGCQVGWADPGATGFAVSGGAKNILVTNNDASVAAALLVAIFGATA